jgi:hypothetical protein
MGAYVMQYIMIAAGLIFGYLLLTNAKGATGLIQAASTANIGAVKALQGR